MILAALCVGPGVTAADELEATPAPSASRSAAAPAASPTLTTLEADGFRVTLDTLGFEQILGSERFKRHYFRIAQFSARGESGPRFGGGFTFSLLVDDVPKGVTDLKSLFSHSVKANKLTERIQDGTLQPVRIPRGTGGILFRFPQRLAVPPRISREGSSEMTQWNWYFESLQNGKWFEMHFSRGVALGAAAPEGVEAGIIRVVSSLQFPASPPGR